MIGVLFDELAFIANNLFSSPEYFGLKDVNNWQSILPLGAR